MWAVTSKLAAFPAKVGTPYSAGKVTSIVRVSPGFIPSSCSLKPGMKPVPSISTSMPLPVPPGNSVPSILPDEIDREHLALRRAAVAEFIGRDLRQRPIALGDVGQRLVDRPPPRASAFSRVSWIALKSGGVISGSSSSSTLNSRSLAAPPLGSRLTTSTFGCSAGRRPRSLSTCWVASLTDSSSTSAVTAVPIALAHHGRRDLAGPKPGQGQRLAEIGQPGGALALDIGGRNHHGVGALQPLGERFGNLHCSILSIVRPPAWCGRRDLNPHGLRHQNLNLACLPVPPRPRSCARPAANAGL